MVTVSMANRSKLMTALSQNIKILRAAKGMSQEQLAGEAGVTRATINRIEKGHRMPDFDLVCKLADLLGTSTDVLRKPLANKVSAG